jgi:hypothetical protein
MARIIKKTEVNGTIAAETFRQFTSLNEACKQFYDFEVFHSKNSKDYQRLGDNRFCITNEQGKKETYYVIMK